eukprot:21828-Eustigmatos_ZCMA.PRE.1
MASPATDADLLPRDQGRLVTQLAHGNDGPYIDSGCAFPMQEGVTYPREIAAHPPETDPLTPPEGTDED